MKNNSVRKAKLLLDERYYYQNLANAIVAQAVSDYDCALTRIATKTYNCNFPYNESGCNFMKFDCENFFSSQYLMQLTNLDGKYLQELVRRRVENKLGVKLNELSL